MTTRPFIRIHSAEDVRTTSDRLGSFFFSGGAMNFFDSRLLDVFHSVVPFSRDIEDGGEEVVYIVTSEREDGHPRQYAVRRVRVWRAEDGRDHIDFDRVLVVRTAQQSRGRQHARTLAHLIAATEHADGIEGVNKFVQGVAGAFPSIVDTEEVR